MKIGGFGRIADYDNMRLAGFDYAELDLPELEELPEEEFQTFCKKVEESNFPVLTGSRALPIADPWFFTDKFSMDTYKPYLENACRRAAQIGMKKVIIGNGKARYLIDETSITKTGRFVDFMKMFCEIAAKNGLEVILEPLGPKYSNYINTLPQAVDMVHEVGMSNLFIMADLRHMVWGDEPMEDVVDQVAYLHHLHIDYPCTFPERPFPTAEDDFDYSGYIQAIKKSGYNDTLTIESDIPEDWNKALKNAMVVLKELL